MWRPSSAVTASRAGRGTSSVEADTKWLGQMSDVAPNQKMLIPVSSLPLSGMPWGMTTS